MKKIVISGSGVFTPKEVITNEELVASFNAYADLQNEKFAKEIARGEKNPVPYSSEEFIVKASGIERRHVMNKSGIIDPEIMFPVFDKRSDDELSLMAEMAVNAAKTALEKAGKQASDINCVIVAASNFERAYPAIAVEVQKALGIDGFAFDMNIACSSATFGIQMATDMIKSGSAKSVLMLNPEICSGHVEWRDRDCHFIFGDVCTAVVIEDSEIATSANQFEIIATKCVTEFSNNIRNNLGFLRRSYPNGMEDKRDMQFMQNGRKVFKEVVPMVSGLILEHIKEQNIAVTDIKRLWLHQANKSMNDMIGRKVLGHVPSAKEQPNILQEYANTSSAGSIVTFSQYSEDLARGNIGVICSFGAGYSVGNVIIRKL
jgi:beta-ketodecanoyl-[acyl-carrier-protein] synthase